MMFYSQDYDNGDQGYVDASLKMSIDETDFLYPFYVSWEILGLFITITVEKALKVLCPPEMEEIWIEKKLQPI